MLIRNRRLARVPRPRLLLPPYLWAAQLVNALWTPLSSAPSCTGSRRGHRLLLGGRGVVRGRVARRTAWPRAHGPVSRGGSRSPRP
ncbi:hypothetical protein QJS66_13430 [Kocuria rhizophila]|nr:hypothetical protein QJS66_13430 [Kocuria rhizophila]